MINTGDKVKLAAIVKETGTGTMTLSVKEFFVDGAWYKFTEPKVLEIGSEDYDNALTELELNYIKEQADKNSTSIALDKVELELVKSISKKLNGGTVD